MEKLMSPNSNPFPRGYQNLRIDRSLCITYEDDCPPVWRPLHPSQAHLTDDQVALFPCVFSNDFALITEGQDIPEDLEGQCQTEGVVRTVVYAVAAEEEGKPLHVGDTYSEEAARKWCGACAMKPATTAGAGRSAARTSTPRPLPRRAGGHRHAERFLFIAFRIPYSPAIGVKLIATPWTDENLRAVEGITAKRLMQEHRKGMPESLVQVLHLAALADVRMLVFDADAQVLDGLPIYDD
jgi:hypothetical protein